MLTLALTLPGSALALRPLSAGQEEGRVDDELARALGGRPAETRKTLGMAGEKKTGGKEYPLPPEHETLEEQQRSEERQWREIRHQLRRYEADYGFLPEDHPAVQTLRRRLEGLLPDVQPQDRPDVRVLAGRGEGVNAFVFPDGTIVVSPELIESAEHLEELDFVLLHEINHWHRKHHDQARRTARHSSLLRSLGLSRYHEEEADVAAFFQMMERKRSGQAAIRFLERLEAARKEEARKGDERARPDWDPAHGTYRDRILNLKTLAEFIHMHYLDAPMEECPKELKEAVKAAADQQPEGGRIAHLLLLPSRKELGAWQKRTDAILGEEAPLRLRRSLLQEALYDLDHRLDELEFAIRLDELLLPELEHWQVVLEKELSEEDQAKPVADTERVRYELERSRKERKHLRGVMRRLLSEWEAVFPAAFPAAFQEISPEAKVIRQAVHWEAAGRIGLYTGRPGEAEEEKKPEEEKEPEEEETDQDTFDKALAKVSSGRHKEFIRPISRKEFDQQIARATDTQELASAFRTLEAPVAAGRAFGLVALVGRLRAEAGSSLHPREGEFDAQEYLRQMAGLLAAAQEAIRREGWLPEPGLEDPSRAAGGLWAEILITAARILIREERWDAKTARSHILAASSLAKKHGFTPDPVTLGLLVGSEKDEKVAKPLQALAEKLSPGLKRMKEQATRLAEIRRALTREIPAQDQGPRNPAYRALVLEALDLLDRLPQRIDRHSAELATNRSWWAQPGEIERAELKQAYLGALLGVGWTLAPDDPAKSTAGKYARDLAPVASLDEVRFWVGCVACLAEDEPGYLKGLESVRDKGAWCTQLKGKVTLEELNRFLLGLNDPGSAAASIGKSTPVPPTGEGMRLFQWERKILGNPWLEMARATLKSELKQAEEPDLFFELLDAFARHWPAAPDPEIVRMGVERTDLALARTDPQARSRLFLLTFFMEDPMIRRQLNEYLLVEQVRSPSVPFSEALDLACRRYRVQRAVGGFRVLEELMRKARTYPEFDALKEQGLGFLESVRGSVAVGALVLAEGGIEHWMKGAERFDLLRDLLASAQDDRGLREYTAGYWKKLHRALVERSLEHDWLTDSLESGKSPLMTGITPFETVMRRIYLMGGPERYLLLRRLLTGEEGVLAQDRSALLHAFLASHLRSNGDAQAADVIQQVLAAAFEVMPEDDLYLLMSPLLMERIANPPPEPGVKTSRALGAKSWAEKMVVQWGKNERLKKKKFRRFVERHVPPLRKKMAWFFQDAPPGQPAELASAENRAFQIVPPEFYQAPVQPMSPLEMIVETARRLGAPGVRFLQLLGQTLRMPPAYRSSFLTVYDDIEGQTPLSMAETIRSALPEYAERIRRFVQRLGGGSLYTVYLVEVEATEEEYPGHGGQIVQETVRVLNPNALYKARKSVETIRQALTKLAAGDPKSPYARALPLVDQLWEWIVNDVNDPTFEADDPLFRQSWNPAGEGWAPDGFQAQVVVPRSIPTGTPVVRRAEFIQGQTFAALKKLEIAQPQTLAQTIPVERQRELVALAAQFYMQQVLSEVGQVLMGAKERTLILSDISVGNFLVTGAGNRPGIGEGNLAILDRGMYLQFDRKEAQLLFELSGAQTTQERVGALMSGLWGMPKEGPLVQEIAGEVDPTLPLEKSALEIILAIQSRRYLVPLKFELLFKNFNALAQMAEEGLSDPARLGSFEKALQYNPVTRGGLEEGRVRPLDPEEFWQAYARPLEGSADSRLERIASWLRVEGVQLREVDLPEWVTLHVRGDSDFLSGLQGAIRNLEGTLFDWRPAPHSTDPADWGKVGMILNDLERLGPYLGPNPNHLPVRNLLPDEVGHLDAFGILAGIFAPLPPGSVFLGAELLPDLKGKVHLILFSA